MYILAFDPGPKSIGYALVERAVTRVRFLSGGEIASDYDALRVVLGAFDPAARPVVAVERPNGFIYETFRGPTVVSTSNVAGGLAWASRAHGHEVIEVPPTTVRTVLLGKRKVGGAPGAVDRAIKEVLPGLVLELPARTNEHVRDALALAIAANWMLLSKRRRTA